MAVSKDKGAIGGGEGFMRSGKLSMSPADAQEKRRAYARTYYQKHREQLKDRYKLYREANKERAKELRHERWLIARYIPPEVQNEILHGDWLALTPQSCSLDQSSPAESEGCIDI